MKSSPTFTKTIRTIGFSAFASVMGETVFQFLQGTNRAIAEQTGVSKDIVDSVTWPIVQLASMITVSTLMTALSSGSVSYDLLPKHIENNPSRINKTEHQNNAHNEFIKSARAKGFVKHAVGGFALQIIMQQLRMPISTQRQILSALANLVTISNTTSAGVGLLLSSLVSDGIKTLQSTPLSELHEQLMALGIKNTPLHHMKEMLESNQITPTQMVSTLFPEVAHSLPARQLTSTFLPTLSPTPTPLSYSNETSSLSSSDMPSTNFLSKYPFDIQVTIMVAMGLGLVLACIGCCVLIGCCHSHCKTETPTKHTKRPFPKLPGSNPDSAIPVRYHRNETEKKQLITKPVKSLGPRLKPNEEDLESFLQSL